jgi:hypothetical protein
MALLAEVGVVSSRVQQGQQSSRLPVGLLWDQTERSCDQEAPVFLRNLYRRFALVVIVHSRINSPTLYEYSVIEK